MNKTMENHDHIREVTTGMVLAGGQARRMGGVDKGLVELNGRPLIEWVIAALTPQVATLLINANRSHVYYRRYQHTIIPDQLTGYCGPLAGIAAGLGTCETDYLVVTPCDSPLLPPDLVSRLYNQLQRDKAEIAVAHNGERLQPVFALIDRSLSPSLQRFLDDGGRKIDQWYDRHRTSIVDFADAPDTFLNINTPEDMRALETRLRDTGT